MFGTIIDKLTSTTGQAFFNTAKSVYNTCFLSGIDKNGLKPLAKDTVQLGNTNGSTLTANDCNLIRHESSNVDDILTKKFKEKPYRIATSGYSFDIDGYEKPTHDFLKELDKQLGSRKTAYIAPPACDKGSIYDITTKISGLDNDRLLYVTSENYLKFLKPGNFSKEINLKKFLKKPIYVFPNPAGYAEATANASNVLVCTGGRKVAVEEIVLALKNRNKVVLLINENLKNGTYDFEKDAVENTAKFFENLTRPSWCKKNDYPIPANLDIEYLRENQDRIKSLVRVYMVNGSKESIKSAAERAGNFIKSKTIYDYLPEDIIKKMHERYKDQGLL